eukprot:GHVP01058751.1.p1 GENE.GHVP01058751.1~~GHVP01058751.1.p1  ORF type:complete len:116 (+),score=13.02 GHVP01058751.1:457-804(+)
MVGLVNNNESFTLVKYLIERHMLRFALDYRKEEEVCKKTESQKHTLLKAQVSLFQFLQPQSFNTDIRNSEELRKQYFTVMEKQSLHPPTCSRRVVLKAPKSYHSYEATRLCLQGL